MPTFDFDLLVLGGGSAGVRCARVAASLGARVALCEERDLGGTCVNLGCVPKKLLSYGAHYGEDLEDAAAYGWSVGTIRFDWPTLVANKDREIARLNGVYERLLGGSGVELMRGHGTLVGPHTVEVNGASHTAQHIAVCTGGWPWVPEFPGREHVITSNEIFHLDRFPERIVIAGGGYIAVEFASILNGLGAHVDLVYRGPLFLRGFDVDVRRHLATEMRKKGVHLHFDASFRAVERVGDEVRVHLTDGDHLTADQALFAVGRRPLTRGLGLEEVGVATSPRGAVLVDACFRSSVPSVYALGDVIERVQLTPVALAEGTALAHHLFGGASRAVDYACTPTAVFCHPNVGVVGLTEADARERLDRIRVYESLFTPMRHTLGGRPEKTYMKLVVDDATDRVVGCHMVGPDAGEIVQGLAVALTCKATKAQFDATLGIHPTAAEEFVTMRTPSARPDPAPPGTTGL